MSNSTSSEDVRKTATEGNIDEVLVEQDSGQDTIFPYDPQTKHWDIDYNDTHQSYEGSALPIWILTGFALYIVWAILYLVLAL